MHPPQKLNEHTMVWQRSSTLIQTKTPVPKTNSPKPKPPTRHYLTPRRKRPMIHTGLLHSIRMAGSTLALLVVDHLEGQEASMALAASEAVAASEEALLRI